MDRLVSATSLTPEAPCAESVPPWITEATWSRLYGGYANDTWLVTNPDGAQVVVKTCDQPDTDRFPVEADGLRVLSEIGGLRTPDVLAVSDRFLVLRALDSNLPSTDAFWLAVATAVATLHSIDGPSFGWSADGWLGRLPQQNSPTHNGYDFFAQRRILRYLHEPLVIEALEQGIMRDLERICARLPDILPPLPPVLTHGDLWRGNIVAGDEQMPVFIDPAVSWTWATVDLSMLLYSGGVPESFFTTYEELAGLDPSWRETAPLLHLREILSCLAHPATTERRLQLLEYLQLVIRKFS